MHRYVSVHFQYILTELLKNAFRASIEQHWRKHGVSSSSGVPSVKVTIASPRRASHDGAKFLSLRVRDEGGGISPQDLSRVFSYAFTTAGRNMRHDDGSGGGPYAAQHLGGNAVVADNNEGHANDGNLFSDSV